MGCGANSNNSTNNHNQLNSSIPFNSKLFIDKKFPPEFESIFGKENFEKIKKGQKIEHHKYFTELIDDYNQNNIVWRRAKDIFNNEEFTLFSSSINNNSIIQGSIGNCYFLSIISCLTKYPSLIYQLFNSLTISQNGYYEIKVKLDKKLTIISLDDFFPYNLRKNMPLFCKPFKNEIWVMILEKALAKIKGSYLNIDNGSPYDILDLFLLNSDIKKDILYKSYILNNDNRYQIWENIFNKLEYNKNSIMICLSKDKLSNKKKLNNFYYSIIENHYYNLIEIYKNNDKEKILKIRNPWGYNLKNENYNKKKNEFDFIIDNEENKQNEVEIENFLGGGELLIDYNYFCYLFYEIQIYEFINYSYNFIINNNKEKVLDLIYINIKEWNKEELEIFASIKFEEGAKIIYDDNKYVSLIFIIIDISNCLIINALNKKLYISNGEINFPLIINTELSKEYYFCLLLFSDSNLNQNNNSKYYITFESKIYFDIINDIQYIQNNQINELLKNELKQYSVDLNYIIPEEKGNNFIFKNIDDNLANKKYLLEKYPKEMKLLLELEPMEDNKENIIFRDKYYYKNNNYYLGEQLYNGNIRHGRGLYYLNKNGNIYLGYNKYGKFVGKGKIIYKDGKIKEGEFINGKFSIN